MYYHNPAEREAKELVPGINAKTFWAEKMLAAVVDLNAYLNWIGFLRGKIEDQFAVRISALADLDTPFVGRTGDRRRTREREQTEQEKDF